MNESMGNQKVIDIFENLSPYLQGLGDPVRQRIISLLIDQREHERISDCRACPHVTPYGLSSLENIASIRAVIGSEKRYGDVLQAGVQRCDRITQTARSSRRSGMSELAHIALVNCIPFFTLIGLIV